MWVEEASKSEGRAVGHVTRTELVADWAFSLIKDQSRSARLFVIQKSVESGGPLPRNVE